MKNQEETAARLLAEALNLPPDQRRAFLDRACGGESVLRGRVEALLKEKDRSHRLPSEPRPIPPEKQPPRSSFAQGDRLGRFTIVRLLGRGGMGVVYEAHDRDRNINVALKTLLNLRPDELLLFKQEFRGVVGIVHPNLVSLYELFAEEEVWFFTMELLLGKNLIEALRSGCHPFESSISGAAPDDPTASVANTAARATIATPRPSFSTDLDSRRAFALRESKAKGTAPDSAALRDAMLQVARGLVAVHNAGKLHRDIKPSNIMLTPERRAVVLDFGLVQEMDSSDPTSYQDFLGTAAYAPPEQMVGSRLTPAADWYALGVTLYQSLTGALPFAGVARTALEAKRRRDLIVPSELVTGVDPELEALTLDLLHPNPWQRPQGDAILSRFAGSSLAGHPSEPAAPMAPSRDRQSPFVGRDSELDRLHAAFESARAGETVFVSVHGFSGVGKTTAVDHFLQSPLDQALILRGRCYEQESVPFKAIDSAMDTLCRQLLHMPDSLVASLLPGNMAMLARLFPVLRQLQPNSSRPEPAVAVSDPRHARRVAITALRDLLRRLAQRRNVIFAIDDLQWGDTDSATLMAELLAAPDPPPMLVLCIFRREYADRSTCLQLLLPTLAENPVLNRVDLPVDPLTSGEAQAFAQQLMGERDSRVIAQIVADSGGSPYFLKVLAEYADSRQMDSVGAVSLEQAFASRLSGLAPDAQRLLEVIAVHGLPLTQMDAYRAAELTRRDPAPLAVLRYANLIRSTGTGETDEVETYHDRVRETVVAGLSAETRRERHKALAATLAETGRADAETLAIHYEEAGDLERAGKLFEAAADRAAATLAFDRAAAFYQRSLRLRNLDKNAEFALRQQLAEALANARGGVEAAEAFESAARLADAEHKLGLERRAAFYYMSSGRVEQGRVVLQRVMKRVRLRLPRTRAGVLALLVARTLRLALLRLDFQERSEDKISERLREQFDAAYAMAAPMGMIDGAQGMSFGAFCLRLSLRAGDPVRMVYGLQVGGYGMTLQGARGRQRAARLLDLARTISARRADVKLAATVAFTAAAQFYVVGEWRVALEHFEEAENLYAKCPGTHWELASARILRMYTLHLLGEFSRIARDYEPILKEAKELDDLYTCVCVETSCQPMALLAADRAAEAREAVHSGLARWKVEQYGLQQVMAAQTLSLVAFYEANAGGTIKDVLEQWRLLKSSGMASFENLRIDLLDRLGRTGLAAAGAPNATEGDRRTGLQMARNALRQLKKQTLGWARGKATMIEAGLQAANGDRSGAAGLLLKAMEQFSMVGMRATEASCRLYAASLIGGERGAEMDKAARLWFASQNIVNADRMAAVFVGGILPSDLSTRN
jgi:serine/threonine protein kinase/tetratricopeptide (TPR) repeat protein